MRSPGGHGGIAAPAPRLRLRIRDDGYLFAASRISASRRGTRRACWRIADGLVLPPIPAGPGASRRVEDLRRQLDADPARWLHIGDNLFRRKCPAAMGIQRPGIAGWAKHAASMFSGSCRRAAAILGADAFGNYPAAGRRKPREFPLVPPGWPTFSAPWRRLRPHGGTGPRRANCAGFISFPARDKAAIRELPSRTGSAGGAPEARYSSKVSRLALSWYCARKGLIHANAFPMALLPARNRDLRDVCWCSDSDRAAGRSVPQHGLAADTPLNQSRY